MSLVVMKFGGSSVADPQKLRHVARLLLAKKRRGHRVVAVVSAPGDMTDELIEKARQVCRLPDGRDLDMLLSTGEQISVALLSLALQDMGAKSVALTGPQAGIRTDGVHTKARIVRVNPAKARRAVEEGAIAIVAGFQGLNPRSDIATLGRGGSDLTAVALAASLNASVCEIYTDVPGVFTADPRVVKEARRIPRISYDEMLELAGSGSQVMQARSVEVAKKFRVPIRVLSTFEPGPGTWITGEVESMEEVVVSGVSYDRNQVKVSVTDVPDVPGVAAKLFGALAKAGINVDMIIQSAAREGVNDISFTLARSDWPKAQPVLQEACARLGGGQVLHDAAVAKVSVVGVGMRSHPGTAAKMFSALAKARINIEMISTSEIKISCVIREEKVASAVRALHQAFGLARRRMPVPAGGYVE